MTPSPLVRRSRGALALAGLAAVALAAAMQGGGSVQVADARAIAERAPAC